MKPRTDSARFPAPLGGQGRLSRLVRAHARDHPPACRQARLSPFARSGARIGSRPARRPRPARAGRPGVPRHCTNPLWHRLQPSLQGRDGVDAGGRGCAMSDKANCLCPMCRRDVRRAIEHAFELERRWLGEIGLQVFGRIDWCTPALLRWVIYDMRQQGLLIELRDHPGQQAKPISMYLLARLTLPRKGGAPRAPNPDPSPRTDRSSCASPGSSRKAAPHPRVMRWCRTTSPGIRTCPPPHTASSRP